MEKATRAQTHGGKVKGRLILGNAEAETGVSHAVNISTGYFICGGKTSYALTVNAVEDVGCAACQRALSKLDRAE